MMTVHEVSRISGVSIRTLQYYDTVGLLKPAMRTEAGYRLYDEAALEKLRQIMLLRELEFSLADISKIISSPDFDRKEALVQQIELLTLKKEHFEELIELAKKLQTGEKNMEFKAFDTKKIDDYAKRAKEKWGGTEEYKESVKKTQGKGPDEMQAMADEMMKIFGEFGKIKNEAPEGEKAQALVKALQDHITRNYYNCSKQVLSGLGLMYSNDPEFKANIDAAGGEGTAEFASKAIAVYCAQ